MALFKNAKQIIIPEDIVDTNSWISDEEIINLFFENDAIDDFNTILSDGVENVKKRRYNTTINNENLFDIISIGEAA